MADYIFNVARLLQSPSGAARDYDVEAPPGALDVPELDGPVRGRVRLIRLATSILAQGAFEVPVVQPCARCLAPARSTVSFETDDEYAPSVDIVTGLPPHEDDERWRLDEHHSLDLAPLLAEGVIAALPLKPLCRTDCRGIDLEHAAPGDSAAPGLADPRWEPLRQMRERMFPGSTRSEG